MGVDLSAMRKMFEVGALRSAIVAPVPLREGEWMLMVECLDGGHDYMTVARTTRQKVYKSLESARADAARVGFSEVRLRVA